MDQAAWHRTSNPRKFENIRIIYQPPYLPEVNPVEHLREHIREKHLRNECRPSLDSLENMLEKIVKLLEKSKDIIRKLVGFHWAII